MIPPVGSMLSFVCLYVKQFAHFVLNEEHSCYPVVAFAF